MQYLTKGLTLLARILFPEESASTFCFLKKKFRVLIVVIGETNRFCWYWLEKSWKNAFIILIFFLIKKMISEWKQMLSATWFKCWFKSLWRSNFFCAHFEISRITARTKNWQPPEIAIIISTMRPFLCGASDARPDSFENCLFDKMLLR